jgi:aerobic C4-dicarboxylate transport protein
MAATTIPKPRKWYLSLWFWVLIFMLLGIAFGVYNPSLAKQMKPIIDNFIHAVKLLVGPIIFLTVVTGVVGMGSLKQLGTIGSKAFIYFEVISSLALVIGLLFGHLFHPGSGMNLSVAQMDPKLVAKYVNHTAEATSMSKILLSAIPHDPISPFVHGNTLQILFIAVIFGFALFYLGGKHQATIMLKLKRLQHYAFKILSILMLFSPIAAFAAMSFMIGEFGVAIIWNMLGLVATMLAACIFFILVVLGIIAKLAGFSIFKFLKFIKDEIILVFATSSSESALGPIMKKLTDNGASDSVVGIVVPAGYSFNLDGTNIYLALVIAFLCHAFNIDLNLQEYIVIIGVLMATSKGAAGVSGAGFIVLAGTLAAMNGKIPVVTIGILLGIDKIMSELRSSTNLIGNSLATVIIAKWEKQLDKQKFSQALDK